MKKVCYIALIMFGFFMIATTVFGWSHRISLLDRDDSFCPSEEGDVKDLLVRYQRKWWAFPLFQGCDYTIDPVYEFYDSTFEDSRRRDCLFYRPNSNYRFGEGRCENCWRYDGGFKRHFGLDVHAPEGTPLIAAADGIVKYAGPWSVSNFSKDPEVMEKYSDIEEFKYYCADSTCSSGGGHGYGNVFLIYYPGWDITLMYSHLHDITSINPFHQDIENATQYEDTSISSGHVFGNVGHSGNASSDTAKMHVDIMVFTGEIGLSSTTDKRNTVDPHEWLYEKSINTRVVYYRRRQERFCDNSLDTTIQDTVAIWEIDDDFSFGELAVGDTFNSLTISEGESGREGDWHYFYKKIYYEFDQGGAHYPHVSIFWGPYGTSSLYCHIRPDCSSAKIGHIVHNLKYKGVLSISPNPFNSACRIVGNAELLNPNSKDSYSIGSLAEVFDIDGRKVCELKINSEGSRYSIDWNAKDEANHELSSGSYFIRFTVNNQTQSAKVTLLK